jgi:hypothetical protein
MPDDPQTRPFEARCSFCRKDNMAVDVLIGGIGVFICNECVDAANDALAKAGPVTTKVPYDAAKQLRASDTEKLLRLAAGAEPVRQDIADYQSLNVDILRERGVSWAEIGQALGVSRQAAWKRFATGPESD